MMRTRVLISLVCTFLFLPTLQTQAQQDFVPYNTKWEVYAHGGWGYRIARISKDTPSDLRGYANSLRSGYTASAGFSRYIHRRFGPGLRYSRFGSSASLQNVVATNTQTGEVSQGKMDEQVAIQLIAPTFNFRVQKPSSPFRLALYVGIGYIDYRNNSNVVGTPIKLSGGNVGITTGANLGFALNQNLSLAAGASLVTSNLSEVRVNRNGTKTTHTFLKNELENLSHVQATLGLHWQWKNRK